MKKILYSFAFLAAVVLVGCNKEKSVNTLPGDVQDCVEEIEDYLDKEEWYEVDEVVVKDKDIIFKCTFKEGKKGAGVKVTKFFKERGKDDITEEIIRDINRHCNPDGLEELREGKYNLIIQFTGDKSEKTQEVKISYKKWPEKSEKSEKNSYDDDYGYYEQAVPAAEVSYGDDDYYYDYYEPTVAEEVEKYEYDDDYYY